MSVDFSYVFLKDSLFFKLVSDINLQKGIFFLDYLLDKYLGKISEDESSGFFYKSGLGEMILEGSYIKDVVFIDLDSVLNYRDGLIRFFLDDDGNYNLFLNFVIGKGIDVIYFIFRVEDFFFEVVFFFENSESSKEEAFLVRVFKFQIFLR